MIVTVRCAASLEDQGWRSERDYAGPVVEASTEDGELLIIIRDERGKMTSWHRWAKDAWWEVFQKEGMDPEVRAAQALAQEHKREHNIPAGNSGPY